MYAKNFDKWNLEKQRIDGRRHQAFFHEREVWWMQIGVNVGFEQDGKNDDFVRPVLIVRKFNNTIFLGMPLSTKRKPNNKFYIEITQHQNEIVAAVISQIRLFDARRLKRKMYRLEELHYEKVRNALKEML